MRSIIKTIFIILLIIGISGIAHADGHKWKIDPAHAGIYFSIDHIFSKVKGHFQDFEGQIFFDPNNLKGSSAVFNVKVKSINTYNSKRDGHLQSDDFFSAKKYPEMRFESSSVSHVDGNQYMLEGIMTIKDVSRNVKLPVTFLGAKTNPVNPKQEVAGFEANLTINRFDYHVGSGKFYEMGVVGKDVDIMITIEATRKK